MLLTFINACDYLDELAPPQSNYMVETGLLTEAEATQLTLRAGLGAATGASAFYSRLIQHPEAGPEVYTNGHFKVQQALSLIHRAETLKVPMASAIVTAKVVAFAEAITEIELSEKDRSPPSLHLFSSTFVLVFMPLLSMGMAQHVADYKIKPEHAIDHALTSLIALFAVALANFAFIGMVSTMLNSLHSLNE